MHRDGVIRVEKVLAVITEKLMALLERPEHKLIRMEPGLRAHVAEHRAVDADLIVLDIVALHGDRHLELFVLDAVLVGLQVAG